MKKETKPYTMMNLIVRLLAGAYLLYTAWNLRLSLTEQPLLVIAMAAFAVIGAVLVGQAVWKLYKKDYEGGNPPAESAENDEEPVA